MKAVFFKLIEIIKKKKFPISILFFMIIQPIFFYFIKYLQFDYHVFKSPIDDNIPFIPYFVYIYDLFFFFVIFSFYYIYVKNKKRYYQGLLASIIATLVCYIIYILYPTLMIRPDLDNYQMDIITSFIMKATYFFDTPAINLFPSIHCLYSFQAIVSSMLCKNIPTKNKILITIFALLIITSIFFVKQHYIYDMISAFILCIITNIIVIKSKLDIKIFKN